MALTAEVWEHVLAFLGWRSFTPLALAQRCLRAGRGGADHHPHHPPVVNALTAACFRLLFEETEQEAVVALLAASQARGVELLDRLSGEFLGRALLANTTLTELRLPCCQWADDDVEAFCAVVCQRRRLRVLGLAGNNVVGEAGAAALARALVANRNLVRLDVCHAGLHSAEAVRTLAAAAQRSQLQELAISGNDGLSDAAVPALAALLQCSATLRALDVEANAFSAAGVGALLAALASPCALEELKLNDAIDGESAERPGADAQGQHEALALADADADADAHAHSDAETATCALVAALQTSSLRIARLGQASSGVVRAVQSAPLLECMRVEMRRTEHAWPDGALPDRLRSLQIRRDDHDEFVPDDDVFDAAHAGSAVARLRGLEDVWLAGARFDGHSLAQVLRGNVSLRTLRLTGCRHLSTTDVGLVVAGLAGSGVETLSLASNGLGPGAEAALAMGLPDTRLRVLELSGNQMQGTLIATVLDGECPHLEHLNLGGNAVSDLGAIAIANSSPRLKMLNLGNNAMGPAGAVAFADLLRGGDLHVECLGLSHNGFGEAGLVLAHALREMKSTSLRWLELRDPSMPRDAAKAFRDVLEDHSVVPSLRVAMVQTDLFSTRRNLDFNRDHVWQLT